MSGSFRKSGITVERKLLNQKLDRNHHAPNAYDLYNKRSRRADEEFIEHCNQSMDSLLVFSGLFSAVTVALIVESYKDLRVEPTARTEQLLEALLRKNAGPGVDSPPPLHFAPSALIVTTNVLFFLSLAFSLFASLGALLVKQWAREVFRGLDRISSPQSRAREHIQRVEGVDDGYFPQIVDAIPMILHFSLFLFFVALLCWLYTVNYIIHNIILAMVAVGCLVYMGMALIPVYRPNAPYKWPVSTVFVWFYRLWTRSQPILGNNLPLIPLTTISNPIICTPITWVERITDPFTSTPNNADYKVFAHLIKEADTVTELEAVIECLRSGLTLTPRYSGILGDQRLDILVEKAANISASCRCFRDGRFDIHPENGLERATIVMQFFDLVLQIAPSTTNFSEAHLSLVLEIADLLLDRALEDISLDEIALHASVVSRIGYRLRKFGHVEKALSVVLTLRDCGPWPRSESEQKKQHPWSLFTRRNWTVEEIRRYQTTISGYLYSLTLLIKSYYPQQGAHPENQLQELLKHTVITMQQGRIPQSDGYHEQYLQLGEALRIEWTNCSGCSKFFENWMEKLMQELGMKATRSHDGTHVIEPLPVSSTSNSKAQNSPVVQSS
ncbi:hypothetical protein CPB86DRAFT_748099 [Serendipita vermifera]|nr:hypothetical protein CPB86DRAFT_748099 [Serendipita vermifera]